MSDTIALLKEIQSDLVGIILPVIITALASFITLIINSLLKIWLENKKNNTEQYKVMQNLYSEFKFDLLDISLFLTSIEQNNLHINMESSLKTYLQYKNDSTKYREEHEEQVDNIDEFIDSVELFMNAMRDLNDYLKKNNIPAVPAFHPIMKMKVNSMLAELQYLSAIISQYLENNISDNLLTSAITQSQLNISEFNSELILKYIKLLDKWFKKY